MLQVLLPSHERHVLVPVESLMRALERQKVRMSISPLGKRTWRGAAKLMGWFRIRRLPIGRRSDAAFFHVNHPWVNALYPYCLTNICVTYSFDCRPAQYTAWQEFFEKNRVRIAFISARQSVEQMARRCATTVFRWLPEAVDPAGYFSDIPLVERPIDVLELGRRFERYHDCIKERLRSTGSTHIYPEQNRGMIFSGNDAVRASFGTAKISLCFPQSVTHPERAGNVETATFRYFESVASKCLVVGHCPQELRDLFG